MSVSYQSFDDPKAARLRILKAQLASVENDHMAQTESVGSQVGAPEISDEALADVKRQLAHLEHRIAYYQREIAELSK